MNGSKFFWPSNATSSGQCAKIGTQMCLVSVCSCLINSTIWRIQPRVVWNAQVSWKLCALLEAKVKIEIDTELIDQMRSAHSAQQERADRRAKHWLTGFAIMTKAVLEEVHRQDHRR
jgi:hypothetical protein